MIQERLKKDTRSNHDTLEELMFADSIMNGTLTLEQYKQLLTTNYLVHEALEDLLFNELYDQVGDELQLYRRRKLPALLIDLHELEMEAPEWAGREQGAESDALNEASVLGALYVLEGATLGGHVIVKRLAVNPLLNRLNLGFPYYQVYGSELIPNWKKFCEVLNKQPESAYPIILDGARRMFEYIAALQRGNHAAILFP